VKRLFQLVLVAAAAKVTYDLVRRQQSMTPLPDGGPYEPAPVPRSTESQFARDAALASKDDLTAVNGIGPVYAGKLQKLDITTFAKLASAEAEALAGDLDVSPAIVIGWQEQARNLGA
jgi:predicted flap endonuclease-1-like 5' DNA nuclease